MTRYEALLAESLRLDDLHDRILRGEDPVGPIMVDQEWIDDSGSIAVIPAAPAARKVYFGRPITTGPISRKLRSDPRTLFSDCAHCHK